MSRRIRIFQVDAFTTDRFTGNPAGVVLDADSLTDAEMLAIARELNNADTAFVLKPDAPDHDLRVRFFTPRTEASFVGHATVATHFVLSREGAPPLHAQGAGGRLRQRQKSGFVNVEVRGTGNAAASQCGSRRRRWAASSTIANASRCSTRWPYPPATSTRAVRCASSAARALVSSSACAAPSSSNSSSPTTRA